MVFALPQELKLAELQKLAFHCGLARSGPKDALRRRIQDAVLSPSVASGARVLSIDLGIRNLAFSLLSPPSHAIGTIIDKRAHISSRIHGSPASLHAWRRQALVSPNPSSSGQDGHTVEDDEEAHSPLDPEDFSPMAISQAAVRFIQRDILPLKPTHVLIEQQRARSGGRAAVLEWTLRVNSLESMLYAIFALLQRQGQFPAVVVPVQPKRVSRYLIGEHVEDVRTAKAEKKRKIELLAHWLATGKEVETASPEAETMVHDYLQRFGLTRGGSGGRRPRTAKPAIPPKLDDLADCVLQGIAFMKWQANKKVLVDEGPDELLELPDEAEANARDLKLAAEKNSSGPLEGDIVVPLIEKRRRKTLRREASESG